MPPAEATSVDRPMTVARAKTSLAREAAVSLPAVEARNVAKLTRTARGALIAVVLAVLVAVPAAAAQPTRTVIHAGLVAYYPAGTGCDFDVTVYRSPGSWVAVTDFSDGRESTINHAIQRTITNDATGATFVETSVSRDMNSIVDGAYRGTISGQFIFQFYPGDVGPDGAVLDHLLALYIQGSATYVVDATTFATLEISIKGTVTDICAAIS
jgi:hypothetical protein